MRSINSAFFAIFEVHCVKDVQASRFRMSPPHKLELVDGWKRHRLTFIAYSSLPKTITKMFCSTLRSPENVVLVVRSVTVLKCRWAEMSVGRCPIWQICRLADMPSVVIGCWADAPSVGSSGWWIHQMLNFTKRKC